MLPINIPDPAQNTLGGHAASGVGGVIEEAGGVSDGVNDGLSVSLEGRKISDMRPSSQLSMQNPATLQTLKDDKGRRLTVGSSSVP